MKTDHCDFKHFVREVAYLIIIIIIAITIVNLNLVHL